MNKQKLTLFVLVIALIGSLVYSYLRVPRQQQVAKLTHVSGPKVPPPPASKDGGGRQPVPPVGAQVGSPLQIAFRDQQYAQFRGFKRNPFKPLFREEQRLIPLPLPPPAPPQKVPAPTTPPAPTPTQPAIEAAKQDMGRLRFLGFLRTDARKTIFLADGAEIFLVRKGDLIAGRYEVASLTDDAVTITVLANKTNLVFPLLENRTLTAGRR